MRFLRVISILCACAAATTSVSAQGKPPGIKAVRFGKLWDGSGKVWSNAIVIVQGERIRAVTTDAATIPPGAEVLDLINRGEMAGPRMFVCGYGLYTTFTSFKPATAPPAGGVADGVPEVLRAVRQQLAAGADVIKMYASTGTDDDVTGFQTYSYEEIKAAVDMAHQFQKKIAVHSYGPDGAQDAVRAGADSVEHATDMDDATIREMAKRGTFYVPTVDHNRYYIENGDKI